MTNLSPRVIFNFEQIFNRTVNRTEFNRFSTAFNQMKYPSKDQTHRKNRFFIWLSDIIRSHHVTHMLSKCTCKQIIICIGFQWFNELRYQFIIFKLWIPGLKSVNCYRNKTNWAQKLRSLGPGGPGPGSTIFWKSRIWLDPCLNWRLVEFKIWSFTCN